MRAAERSRFLALGKKLLFDSLCCIAFQNRRIWRSQNAHCAGFRYRNLLFFVFGGILNFLSSLFNFLSSLFNFLAGLFYG